MELLNRHRKKFDCNNKNLDDNENVKEFQQNQNYPYNIAYIPGVELENDYKKIFGHVLQLE